MAVAEVALPSNTSQGRYLGQVTENSVAVNQIF